MNVILRKTGNSTVIIIPHQIKETFGAEIREEIEFVTLGNNVIIRKAEPKFNFDKELYFRSLMNEDRKYRDDDENLGDHGYTAQEFQGEELVDVEEPESDESYEDDDLGIEFNEISDDEF